MNEKSVGKEIYDKLSYSKKSYFESCDAEKIKAVYDYANGYKAFLDKAKTEREACREAISMLKKNGYTEYKLGDTVKVGDKKYFNQHGRSIVR